MRFVNKLKEKFGSLSGRSFKLFLISVVLLLAVITATAFFIKNKEQPEVITYDYNEIEQQIADEVMAYLALYLALPDEISAQIADAAVQNYNIIITSNVDIVSDDHTDAIKQRIRLAIVSLLDEESAAAMTDDDLDGLSSGIASIIWNTILGQIEATTTEGDYKEGYLYLAESIQNQINELEERKMKVSIQANIKNNSALEGMDVESLLAAVNGIDESVRTNMEHLAQAAVIQTNTEGTLKEVTNTLSGIETQIVEVEKVLTDTVVENVNSSTDSIKESVSETKTELSTQIETGNKDTQKILSDTQKQIDEVEKTLSESIAKNVTELKKNIEAAKKDINTILSDMIDENDSNFQQTYEKLNTLQNTLDTVNLNLNTYYKDLTKLIQEFQKQNTEEHEEILAALLKTQEGLNEYFENSFESLNLRMDEDMKNLMEELNVLHSQIVTTQDELTNILNIMEENNAERQQEVRDMFADAKNYLTYIEETFTDAHSKLQDIIIKFKEMEEANHAETLNVLQVMERDMQETTENGFQNLTETMNSFETSLNSTLDTMQENIFSSFSDTNNKMENNFQSMNENVDNKFSETNNKLENNFQDVKNSMTQNFTDLNTNITTKNNEMLQSINNNLAEKVNNLDTKVSNLTTTINNYNTSNGNDLKELKEQLAQVFTSVSNGKASLASALLTKGISLGKEDATFREIYDGILRSPAVDTSIAATVDNISQGKGAWVNGELLIGNGNDVNAAYSQGYIDGVNYTTENANISYVYHQHTGSSSSGGGCYGVYHAGTEQCTHYFEYGVITNVESVGDDGSDTMRYYLTCYYDEGTYCSNRHTQTHYIEAANGYDAASHCGNYNRIYTHTVTTGSPYYTVNCGKTTSTIESATIIFN